MHNIFSKSQNPCSNPTLELKQIWNVRGDKDYLSCRLAEQKTETIALRTISGKGELHLEGSDIFILEANSLVLFRYEEVIEYLTHDSHWDFYWFEFNIDNPGSIGLKLNHKYSIQSSEQEIDQLRNCFNLLHTPKSGMLCSSLFSSILLEWEYKISRKMDFHDAIDKAVIDIVSSSQINLSVNELAERYKYSERQFRNLFIDRTGKTPKEYIQDHVLLTAYELLTTTRQSIKYITSSLGYENQYYFSRAFKKKYGFCPSSIRNLIN